MLPVPLGAQLVGAFKGHGLAPIGQSTGRCALSVRPWTLNWALVIGARVEIL